MKFFHIANFKFVIVLNPKKVEHNLQVLEATNRMTKVPIAVAAGQPTIVPVEAETPNVGAVTKRTIPDSTFSVAAGVPRLVV